MSQQRDLPLSYGVLLYPGFEVLDVAGPLNCLNSLTRRLKGVELSLAVIGRPSDADPALPALVTPADKEGGPLGFSFASQQVYNPTHTFHHAPALDVLIIPGGVGALRTEKVAPEIAFLRQVYPSLQFLFTVCNGSGIAASAGVLDGHHATSNKSLWSSITALGPRTHWTAKARWVVSGNIWTTSGVSAGIDGMLAFLGTTYGHLWEKTDIGETLANAIEHTRAADSSDDPFAAIFGAADVPPMQE